MHLKLIFQILGYLWVMILGIIGVLLIAFCGFHLARHLVIAIGKAIGLIKIDKSNRYFIKHSEILSNDLEYEQYRKWAIDTKQEVILDKEVKTEVDKKIKGLVK